MFRAEVDQLKNLLRVGYSGRVTPDETKRAVEEVQGLLDQLQPGFTLLSDLSNLEAMDLACVPHLKKLMDLCNKKGAARVVRVIPDPYKDIGLNILSLFHYGRKVRIVTFETMAEALKALAV